MTWSNDEELRSHLRSFLDEHNPGRPPRESAEQREWKRGWARTLVEHGWAGPSWPKRWHGLQLSLHQQVVYHEEVTRARVPSHPDLALGMVGPTIIQHGTDVQRERFLLRMLRADDLWCQGFSEPDAGSDLASLRTRAKRDGDDYVLNGQKIWTTNATVADWCFVLARTGPPDSRQEGISYLLVDMRSPGLQVCPLRDMSGGAHFAELFFHDVRVPVENRVGPENDGWRVARTTLGHERSTASIARSIRYRRIVSELHHLAKETGAAADAVVRQRLAQMEILARVDAMNGERVLRHALAEGDVGPVSSVTRLAHAIFEQRLHELAVDVLGAGGMLADGSLDRRRSRWVWGFLRTRASTIGGGTSEVQRNTVAEHVLGLPHEPAVR